MRKMKIFMEIAICLVVLTTIGAAERPTVIMTFDDGWLTVHDNAYPIMQSNNQTGVAFVYIDPIVGAGYADFMKKAQLDVLYKSGWDISSHTYSHTNLTTANSTTLNYELAASRNWLNTNGYLRSAMFLAYPEGAYDTTVIDAVKLNGYVAARTVELPDSNYSHYNLSSSDIFKLKAYETVGGVDNDITVINQINNTIATNGFLILTFHKIVDNLSAGTASETEFRKSDFQNVSNYLKNRSVDIDVRSLSEYFGVMPAMTYMPPSPTNVTSTIDVVTNGSGLINVSWSPGIGDNMTNLYNVDVNGVSSNNSVNTFINITPAIPGLPYDVKIYAINNTNGVTVNQTPATISVMIPLYMPPSPTNVTSTIGVVTNGSGLINVSWSPGIGDNMTNLYNVDVNGVWSNNSVNTFINITPAIPGLPYDVKMYAVNNTNGMTVNQTPATISVMIPLYMPPTPVEINQTSGNFWVYFEWNNGTGGNVTDLYNYSVDGIWTNLSTNKSVNVTTLPHGQVNVSVYAHNSSNGGVQNISSLIMSAQVQNNLIEIGNIWAEYDIYAGDTLRIIPTEYNPDNDTIRFTTNATINITHGSTNRTNVSMNSTTGVFILNTSSGDEGTYYWNIAGYDDQGPPHTIDFMVVITTKPLPPTNNGGYNGGGSNGGGGANIYDPNVESYEILDSKIRYDTESIAVFAKNKLVSNVTFYGIRNYGDATVKVSILKGNPTGNYLDNVYKFFSINLDTMQQKSEYLYISNTTVTVIVNKSNLSDNIIKAYRYANSSWIAVDIEDTHVEDVDTKQFKLNSGGLSNFAIILEPREPIPTLTSFGKNEVKLNHTEIVGNVVEAVSKVHETLYRTIINLIKKYMWWI